MEDLAQAMNEIGEFAQSIEAKWDHEIEQMHLQLEAILRGETYTTLGSVAPSPQQSKKRPKHLSSITDSEEESLNESEKISHQLSASSGSFKGFDDAISEVPTAIIEPPNPTPLTINKEQSPDRYEFIRPVRAVRLKTEKSLKELPLNVKIRRPTDVNTKKSKKSDKTSINVVKLENEQKPSQIQLEKNTSDDIILVASDNKPPIEISSDEELRSSGASTEEDFTKKLKVVIKQEKVSLSKDEENNTEKMEQINKTDPIEEKKIIKVKSHL